MIASMGLGPATLPNRDEAACRAQERVHEATSRPWVMAPVPRHEAAPAAPPKPKRPAAPIHPQDQAMRMRKQGRSFSEIGKALGVSRQRVHQMVVRGLRRIERARNITETHTNPD